MRDIYNKLSFSDGDGEGKKKTQASEIYAWVISHAMTS